MTEVSRKSLVRLTSNFSDCREDCPVGSLDGILDHESVRFKKKSADQDSCMCTSNIRSSSLCVFSIEMYS